MVGGGSVPSSAGPAPARSTSPDELLGMLALVACDNQLGKVGDVKRVFSQRDAEAALAGSAHSGSNGRDQGARGARGQFE